MTESDRTEYDRQQLKPPSKYLAEQVLRKVGWDDRLDGYIYDPGPGNLPEWVFSLEELHNLLKGLPSFSVDFRQMQHWVGETLGDKETAEAIANALAEKSEEEARPLIAGLLGERLAQCQSVLKPETKG